MQVLKHTKNKRLFLATPELMKHKHMEPASDLEASAFLQELGASNKALIAHQEKVQEKAGMDLTIPEGFETTIDISTMGKPELLMIAKKINLNLPGTLPVKALKQAVAEALATLNQREQSSKSEESSDEGEDEEAEEVAD